MRPDGADQPESGVRLVPLPVWYFPNSGQFAFHNNVEISDMFCSIRRARPFITMRRCVGHSRLVYLSVRGHAAMTPLLSDPYL